MEPQRLEPAQAPRVLGDVPGQILQDFGVLASLAQGQVMLARVLRSMPLQPVH